MTLLKDLYRYQVQIVKPKAGENLVKNPRTVRSLDGYTSRGGAAMSLDDTHTRRGPQCIRVGGQFGESGVYNSPFTLESGKFYSFSVDVFAPAGLNMALEIGNVAGTQLDIRKEFVGIGNWQRVEVNYQKPVGSSSSNRRLSVLKKASVATEVFWVDGFQFEESEKATTFIMGYEHGLGYIDNGREYWWDGLPYASSSKRSPYTRHGGELIDLREFANIRAVNGLGMSPFEQITTPIVTGGEIYQKHIRKARPFSIQLQYTGDNVVDIQKKRQAVLDLVRPDFTPHSTPLVMRVQMVDTENNEAGDPVDIVCAFLTSHTNTPNNVASQIDTLNFVALDGHLFGAFRNGATLDYRVEFTANHIVRRDPQGRWVNAAGNNPMAGVASGRVYDIKEAPNGDIYVCGNFPSVANGGVTVANTKGIARWNPATQLWQAVGNPETGATITEFRCMTFDANGDLIAGGNFTKLGNVTGNDYIAKFVISSSQWVSVGPAGSLKARVNSIAISSAGVIYAGGKTGIITGSSRSLAFLNDPSSIWIDVPIPAEIYQLKFHPNRQLLIASALLYGWDGIVTTFPGTTGNIFTVDVAPDGTIVVGGASYFGSGTGHQYIGKWNGTGWERIGDANFHDWTLKVYFDTNGDLYVIGAHIETDTNDLGMSAVYRNGAWQSLEIKFSHGFVNGGTFFKASDGSLYIGGDFRDDYGMSTVPNPGEIEYKITASSGSANAYPEFTIVGPGKLDSIINHSTGRRVQFNDLTLLKGEEIWVQLDPTNLIMKSSWKDRGSVWRYMNAGSDIGDWYIKPGINYIGVFIPEGFDAATTKAFIQWIPKYWSLDGAAF